MKVIKIIDKEKKYTAKNGKEYISVNYYLVLDNNKYIPIRPAFKDGYVQLDMIAYDVKNGKGAE